MNNNSFLPKIQKVHSFIEVKCVTWSKDSHGLFDYESKSIQVQKNRIDTPCRIYRTDQQEIRVHDTYNTQHKDKDKENEWTMLTEISQASLNQFNIKPHKLLESISQNMLVEQQQRNVRYLLEKPDLETFLIVRSLKGKDGQQKGYDLQIYDLLKLGRIEYQVVEMKIGNQITKIKEQFTDIERCNYRVDYSKNIQRTCKICLSEEVQEEDNPFISPCSCKGSCQYVHFLCLKQWVLSKIHKKESLSGTTTSYKWKKLECELCQCPLPKVVDINQKTHELIDIDRPQQNKQSSQQSQNYIILESIARDKKYSKGLYLIRDTQALDENGQPTESTVVAKMGRGHQSDIRISDISVSRLHAQIKFQNGKFQLFDNNSKFGTLIKLADNFSITDEKMAIQVGRTVVTFVNKEQPISSQQPTQTQQQQNIQNNNNNLMTQSSLQSSNLVTQQQFNQINNNNIIEGTAMGNTTTSGSTLMGAGLTGISNRSSIQQQQIKMSSQQHIQQFGLHANNSNNNNNIAGQQQQLLYQNSNHYHHQNFQQQQQQHQNQNQNNQQSQQQQQGYVSQSSQPVLKASQIPRNGNKHNTFKNYTYTNSFQ